jgi:hypothetical protein
MAEDSIITRIEQDARKALIQNAFFRWESALTVSAAILLSVFFSQPFPFWPWWGWPVIGLVAEIALVVSSLTDKAEQQRVIETLFREKYNSSGIRDRNLRAKLAEAEQYLQRIQQTATGQRSSVLRDRLKETANQVYDWIANMVRLARRIDAYRTDDIIRRDGDSLPREIKELTARMNLETNAQVRQQMAATLASKQQFAANLQELQDRMERADLQLDHSLAALGTVYSQMLLVGSADVDSNRAEQLRDDIKGEVLALQDLVDSLNEVYRYDAGSGSGQPATPPAAAQPAARHDQAGRF